MTARQEPDGWSTRLANLATLSRFDALAIVLPAPDAPPSTYAAHNLPQVTWGATPAGAILAAVLGRRTAAQLNAAGIPLADGRNAESLVASPIVWKDQLVGALVGLVVRALADDDAANLARTADILAVDLADANVAWRVHRQTRDLEGRLRASRELSHSMQLRDLSALLDRAVDQVAELYGADGASIQLLDDDGYLTVRSSRGLTDEAKRDRKAIGEGISGTVVKSGQPTILSGPVAGEIGRASCRERV